MIGFLENETPRFFGQAEANTIIRLFADLNADGEIDTNDPLIAQTVAKPFDGTNQFPCGRWEVTSNRNLNDEDFFSVLDGLSSIRATARRVRSPPDSTATFLYTSSPENRKPPRMFRIIGTIPTGESACMTS